MNEAERGRVVRSIAANLATTSEAEVDEILRTVGATSLTPPGWGNLDKRGRRDSLVLLLAGLGDIALETLGALDGGNESSAGRIAEYVADLSESQADLLLRSAGAVSVTPPGWGNNARSYRVMLIALRVASYPPEVRARLSLLVEDPAEDSDGAGGGIEMVNPVNGEVGDSQMVGSGAGLNLMPDGPIFVVHGRAKAVLHEAVRVLERTTGRDVVVLHEQANEGRTILEKFEHHAVGAAYAVVLLTGDDEGGLRAGPGAQLRGRQNVIFELGFFFGKLGRDRVAVLLDQGVERPSDIEGLVYVELDGSGAWKQALARELVSAGIDVDYSRMP